jgi:hypothetical protein
LLRDFQLEAANEILSEFREKSGIEWKDEDAILNFALDNNLFDMINGRMKVKAEDAISM